jgi:hypothetical protein
MSDMALTGTATQSTKQTLMGAAYRIVLRMRQFKSSLLEEFTANPSPNPSRLCEQSSAPGIRTGSWSGLDANIPQKNTWWGA